jgi:hypothetical protein
MHFSFKQVDLMAGVAKFASRGVEVEVQVRDVISTAEEQKFVRVMSGFWSVVVPHLEAPVPLESQVSNMFVRE